MIPPSRPPSASVSAAAPQSSFEDFTQKRGFNFRHFWHLCLERLWIVTLCTIAGLFLSLAYLARTPKLYQGHTVLEVDSQEPTVLNNDASLARAGSTFLASQEALKTIEQNLRNWSFLARVVRAENLAEDGGRALLGGRFSDAKENRPSPKLASTPSRKMMEFAVDPSVTPLEEALGDAISSMVMPVIRRGTRLIDLYVTNRDPAMAQRLAEAVGREFILSSIERRASFNQYTLHYLLEEEKRLKNLQKSEAAVAEYKANTPDALQLGGGAAATGSQTGADSSGSLVENKLQELSSKLTATKSERIKLESELAQVEEAGRNVEALLAVQGVASAPTVNDRRRDLAQIESSIAVLSQRYKEKHPKMIAAEAALKEAQNALRRAVLAQPALMKNALQQARTTETSLESTGHDEEKGALALTKAAIGYQELARQAQTDRALYESVLRQIKETNLTKDVIIDAVSVTAHSRLPRRPFSPHPVKAIILGLLGGLAVGIALVYVADALDPSIKTVEQAEAVIGSPVLAAIPESKDDPKKHGNKREQTPHGAASYRPVADNPGGMAAEAFRNLRAALSLLGPEADRKIFLFTSALPKEGKSFTSVNYALALAQQGHRVLLIDGDLRYPNLHKVFRPASAQAEPHDSLGIVDYLVAKADLAQAARPVSVSEIDFIGNNGNSHTATGGQLNVLTGGHCAPNPAEILSGPRFAELLAEASRLYDRVVVDSAPVLAVSDTLLMTPFIQTVCMVVRARKTPLYAVRRAVELLASAGVRPAGLVLNRLPKGLGQGYYYYYYASTDYGPGEGSYHRGERRQLSCNMDR